MQHLGKPALRVDLLVITRDVCHIKGERQRLGVILDRISDDRAGYSQVLAHDGGSLGLESVDGHEVLGTCLRG